MVVSNVQKYRRQAPVLPGEKKGESRGEKGGERERFFICSGADSSVWQKDPRKYGIAQTYESQAMCSVVIASKLLENLFSPEIFLHFPPLSGSGKIYHQALVDQNTCNDPNYIARIAFNVAKNFRDPGSKITVRDFY